MFSTIPSTKNISQDKLQTLLIIIGASLFITLAAQVRVFLYFTPVPITLQTLAVMLVGASLGSKKGALAILLYIAEATCGLPVLAGWRSEPTFMFSPLGGYYLGFVFQAWITGYILEQSKTLFATILALSCGTIAMLGLGLAWMACFVGWSLAPSLGLYPFIPVEALKIVVASIAITFCQQSKFHL